MPRIREITLDNLKIKIAPLSWDEAEAYIKEGKAMLEQQPPPTLEDWAKRTLTTVIQSMNKANPTLEIDIKKLSSEFDMVTVNEIFNEIMTMSGLMSKGKTSGEAQATSTSS